MFTGLIEVIGALSASAETPGGRTMTVRTAIASELQPGDSIAVNGVCLTVTSTIPDGFTVDVGPETLRVTTLGRMTRGDGVNLERAMRGDGRFGGHFVQGHIDGVGRVEKVWADGDSHWLTISYPSEAAGFLVPKGAVAVDGVSLTVAALRDGQFDVMIIPFTWEHTNLASREAGEWVNLEFDMVGKYVARAAELAELAKQR